MRDTSLSDITAPGGVQREVSINVGGQAGDQNVVGLSDRPEGVVIANGVVDVRRDRIENHPDIVARLKILVCGCWFDR